MNRQTGIRIAVLGAAVAAGFAAMQMKPAPVGAAAGSSAQASAPAAGDPGAKAYADHCAICHGDHREGNLPAFPPIQGIERRLSESQITDLIHKGKDRMPGFPDLKDPELSSLVHFVLTPEHSQQATSGGKAETDAGQALFRQNCSFCHGRDAMGGETGPDLTQSKLVLADKSGDQIATVVREGRPAKKMPGFKFSDEEMRGLVAFIHDRVTIAEEHPGGRRGVAVEDLQTGNAEAGRQYFAGAGGCAKCHSPAGDLAGIASRYQGLQLEQRMLYPEHVKSSVTVTLPDGKTVTGMLAYRDEFTVALREADDTYRSWSTARVRFKVDSPVDAHVEQFPKYSDDDIHNLMAYLQTLK